MFIDDMTDKAVVKKVQREVARELKKQLFKRCYAITGYGFIDTDNPVYMTKLGLRLRHVKKGVGEAKDFVEVYHESLPYPIYRYYVTPYSTHTLSIHSNGVMTECEYPSLAFEHKDSLDWKLYDLKIIHVEIVSQSAGKLFDHVRRFYREANDKWYQHSLNMIIPFKEGLKAGIHIHMYRSRKAGGLRKSAAIYDKHGRLVMFMGVDTLIANEDLICNYTETEFYKMAVYLGTVTGRDSDIIATDGAYKPRTEESKIGYGELISNVMLEYGIMYGRPTIIDTSKIPYSELDTINTQIKHKKYKNRKA